MTISDSTSGATIYYTTNGSTPSSSSAAYTGPITVSSTETLQAIAAATGDNSSAVSSAVYSITTSLPSAVPPTFSPIAGNYSSTQSVTISDSTSGSATIYYTTDGSTPSSSSVAYAGPITVSSTETLQAIAVATGDTVSAVSIASYSISSTPPAIATPVFSPAAGMYSSAQSVTISDATPGTTLYYTINGAVPTASSTEYTGPITVGSTETLQAIAVATGVSGVGSAAYTISAQPNFMLATSVNAITVNSGGQGTLMVTVTPENGFDSPVILACSGLPSWATCAFDQSTITPSGGAANAQLTISTTAQSSAWRPQPRGGFPFTALALTVGLFGWRKRRGWHPWLVLTVCCVFLGLLSGCGKNSGTGGASGPTNPSASTTTVTITAISGKLQGNANITVTVQ